MSSEPGICFFNAVGLQERLLDLRIEEIDDAHEPEEVDPCPDGKDGRELADSQPRSEKASGDGRGDPGGCAAHSER